MDESFACKPRQADGHAGNVTGKDPVERAAAALAVFEEPLVTGLCGLWRMSVPLEKAYVRREVSAFVSALSVCDLLSAGAVSGLPGAVLSAVYDFFPACGPSGRTDLLVPAVSDLSSWLDEDRFDILLAERVGDDLAALHRRSVSTRTNGDGWGVPPEAVPGLLAVRILMGAVLVGRAKLLRMPEALSDALASGGFAQVEALVTRPEVEEALVDRVRRRSARLVDARAAGLVGAFFRRTVIGLTRAGQVRYVAWKLCSGSVT